jgi:Uncharacterized protein conserved in bacteria
MILRWIGLGLVATALASGKITPTYAQEEPRAAPFTVRPAPRGPDETLRQPYRGETVLDRPRPEYDPLGVRLGGFYLFPRLDVYEIFNDNVFASDNDEKSDFITNVVPAVALQSDWGRHALNFSAGSNSAFYSDYTRQDFTEYFVNGNGRLDITGDSALFGGGGFAHRYILPGTPDFQTDAREPSSFDVINGFMNYNQNFGRIRTVTGGQFERFTYGNQNLVDGSNLSQSDDDYNAYSGSVRVGYEMFPNYEVYVQGKGNRRVYDEHNFPADRSSTGYSAVTGIALDLGGILFGELYLGYLQQFYDDGAYKNIHGLDGGGSLTWNVTTLTTITTRITREVNQTTQENVSGILTTTGGVDVDHELLRNLILNANFSYVNDDYENINRSDEYYVAGLGARYLFTRNFSASFGYRFVQRDSNQSANEYSRNLVRIGVRAQL